jgi:hypothetical protein
VRSPPPPIRLPRSNLRLFGDSDSRGQYEYRLITGAYIPSLWWMTFGFAPRIEWDARIKNRGVVGVGEAADLIHHAQITSMPRRRTPPLRPDRPALRPTGPPPDVRLTVRPFAGDELTRAGRLGHHRRFSKKVKN